MWGAPELGTQKRDLNPKLLSGTQTLSLGTNKLAAHSVELEEAAKRGVPPPHALHREAHRLRHERPKVRGGPSDLTEPKARLSRR